MMSRHTWRWEIYQRSTDPERLRRFVRKHEQAVFSPHDRKVLLLCNSWDWAVVAAGVRAESRQMRHEVYDPAAPCFVNKNMRIFHIIRRVMAPTNIFVGLQRKARERITL